MVNVEIFYRCGECGDEHDFESYAEDCCKNKKPYCARCNKEYDTEAQANACEKRCKEKFKISRGIQKTLI